VSSVRIKVHFPKSDSLDFSVAEELASPDSLEFQLQQSDGLDVSVTGGLVVLNLVVF
jgi:hypothetical protein